MTKRKSEMDFYIQTTKCPKCKKSDRIAYAVVGYTCLRCDVEISPIPQTRKIAKIEMSKDYDKKKTKE